MNEVAVVVLGLLASVVLYSFQKWRDREADLRAEKSKAYQEYLSAVFRHLGCFGDANEECLEQTKVEMAEGRIRILCIGTDDVIKAVNAVFGDVPANPSTTDLTTQLERVSDLILAMRKDVFPRTQLGKEELSKSLPLTVVARGTKQ